MPPPQLLLYVSPTLYSISVPSVSKNQCWKSLIALNRMQRGGFRDSNFFLTTESWRAHNSTRDWSRMVKDGVCVCGYVWVCAWGGVGQEGKALSSGPCGNWLNFPHWWTWKWPISITGVSMNSLPWTGPGLTQCPELRVIRWIHKAGPGIASESAFCQLLCEDLGTWK